MATGRIKEQFQGIFSEVFYGSFTVDPGATGADGVASGDVTLPGVALGDYVLVSPGVDVQDVAVTAYVTAANTITWQATHAGAGVDLASSTWKFIVLRTRSDLFV